MALILDDWQKEVKKAEGDILLCTGRRSGKTQVFAEKAVDEMAMHKNLPVVIISLTEDQAMIIMSMALNYAMEKYPKLVGKGKNKPTMRTMMINGGTMKIRPAGATGDGARGFEGGILYVDEASRMPPMFWIAAKPILLTTNGRIWLSSTPYGKQGYFWERFNEAYNQHLPTARFKVFYKSSVDVITKRPISATWTQEQHDGAIRILEEERKEMTALEFGQEYEGLFLEELRSFLSMELIEKCCVLKRRQTNAYGEYFMGCDIGGGGDPSTFEIFDAINKDAIDQVENIEEVDKSLVVPRRRIESLHQTWKLKQVAIDNNGLGQGVFDQLLYEGELKNRVRGLSNATKGIDRDDGVSRALREDMYLNMKVMMELGKVKFLDDENLKASLSSLQEEIITKDNHKTEYKVWGRNSHIAEGIIRALWLIKNKPLNLWAF